MTQGSNAEPRRRFGLEWALLFSVLVHVVLVVFTVWFPLGRGTAIVVADEPEESITFTFDRPSESTTDDPLEDARFDPAEPRPAEQPTPQVPLTPAPDSPEIAPVPFEDPSPPEPEIAKDTPPTEVPDEPEPAETAQQEEPPGAHLPDAPDPFARDAPPDAGRPGDLQDALREFSRAMANRPPRSAASVPSTATPQNLIMPDLSSIPVTGFGVGNLEFESRDYDWTDYGRQIYMAIWRAWHNRLWATTDEFEKWAFETDQWRLHHRVRVRFVIQRNGQVTGIVEEEGSGCGPLDLSALDALAEVILPPLPAGFPRDREVVHASFLADGPVRAMRPVLGQRKALGHF